MFIEGVFQTCLQRNRKHLRAPQKRALHHLTGLTKRGREAPGEKGRQTGRARAADEAGVKAQGFNHTTVPAKEKTEACV